MKSTSSGEEAGAEDNLQLEGLVHAHFHDLGFLRARGVADNPQLQRHPLLLRLLLLRAAARLRGVGVAPQVLRHLRFLVLVVVRYFLNLVVVVVIIDIDDFLRLDLLLQCLPRGLRPGEHLQQLLIAAPLGHRRPRFGAPTAGRRQPFEVVVVVAAVGA